MTRQTRKVLAAAIALGLTGAIGQTQAQTLSETLTGGKVTGAFNLRYEGVEEDNALKDAHAMTLRSALKYTTASLKGFSAVVEAEDVRVVGVDDYTVGPTGFNAGRYSTIADPETTEINQGYLQYVNGGFMARLGRQDLRYDNMRFIGAVPWRQDFQTFDALSLQYKQEKYTLDYQYMEQRERIFAQDADIDSKDHLLHGAVTTPIGSLVGYAYLLEEDIPLDNSLDTVGVRLSGARKLGTLDATYLAEYAAQEMERGAASFDAGYFLLEGGLTVSGVTAKLGYESLGSDNGAYGFATPLATLHAFQGWADQFLATPNQGIEDLYLSMGTRIAGGNFTFVYHDYSADEDSAAVDDLGSEFDLQWLRPFKTNYQFGIKYADYSQGDLAAKADKRILWTWVQMSF